MRTLRWKKTNLLTFAVFVIGCGIFCYMLYLMNEYQCSEEESLVLIQDICKEYKKQRIAGNLCSDLCESQKVLYQKCTNYRKGKKVLFTECENSCVADDKVKAVLKTKNKERQELDRLILPKYPNGSVTEEAFKIARVVFNDLIYSNLRRTDIDTDVFSYLWSQNFDEYVKNTKDYRAPETALQSIWSLAQQDEYLFMRLNQHLSYIPQLYGTCGSYYMIQYAPPSSSPNPPFLRSYPTSWRERAKIALQMIELTNSIEIDFHEPLHMCDVKEENFGFDEHKILKLIDMDTVFFHSDLLRFLKEPRCANHVDCDFFDCHGLCNLTSGRCIAQRTNNNLQSICEDIFINRAQNIFSGLLHNPPADIKYKLSKLLQECAYPNQSKEDIVRQKASQEVHWQLYNVLKQSIDKTLYRTATDTD